LRLTLPLSSDSLNNKTSHVFSLITVWHVSIQYLFVLDVFSYLFKRTVQVMAVGLRLRLSWIQRQDLTSSNRIEFDVLRNILDTFIAGYEWKE